MPDLKPISREYRIYLALWRKAILSGEFSVQCTSHNMALAIRQGMYRAIKPYRIGLANDAQLLDAAQKYVLYLKRLDDDSLPHEIVFKERMTLNELEGLLEGLDISEEDLLVGDERRANESLKALLAGQEAEATETRETPFFKRD